MGARVYDHTTAAVRNHEYPPPAPPPRAPSSRERREDFRPFAPSVLAEEAEGWFEGLPPDGSPYMSLTAPARPEVVGKIPAVCHVDGSSRLQTVRREFNPLYHRRVFWVL